MDRWSPHCDGFISDHIGVFPYLFSSWEVWVKVESEWKCYDDLQPFKTIEEAKAAANELRTDGQQSP